MAKRDRIGEIYRGEAGSPEFRARTRDRVNWIATVTEGHVLDVGCSQGTVALVAARNGHTVTGVDADPAVIKTARAELGRRPPEVRDRLEFRVGEAAALEFEDATFDSVVAADLLEHLADPVEALREIARVAKPRGRIVLTTPFGHDDDSDGVRVYFVASLVATLATALTVESLEIGSEGFRVLARPGAMSPEAAARLTLEAQSRADEVILATQRRSAALRARYKQQAVRHRHRAAAAERRRRRMAKRVGALRRSRWVRLGSALSRARTPRGALALPRALARALRKLDRSPRQEPSKRRRRVKPAPTLRSVADAGGEHLDSLLVDLPEIPAPPGGPVARPGLRVATVVDHFSALGFRYEWNQVEVGPADWREMLEPDPPDLLFVESAWRASNDRWARIIADRKTAGDSFAELVSWCRERGVPTVFWNKEDPPRFATFIEAAALFDHVLTTDSNCFGPYREALGREEVSALSFAAQPRIHNPVSLPGGRAHPVAFAGTYIAHRHPERRRQMDLLLDPARAFGLHIFARVAAGVAEQFEWPERYLPHVVGALSYERMVGAYKSYKVFLNVNSVTTSPTMCARRVFELSAAATPVLSGYSLALEEMFGGEIAIATSAGETREQLGAMLADPAAAELRAHEAMRHVLREHTYSHRVDEILRIAGIAGHERSAPAPVSVVVGGSEPPSALLEQIEAQTVAAHEVIVAGEEGLEAAARRASGSRVAFVEPGHAYDEHYLEDLIGAFTYTDAEVVGKPADPSAAHSYSSDLATGSIVASAEAIARLDLAGASPGPGGARAYAADPYSFRSAPVPA